MNDEKNLEPPDEFRFPFPPYDIQEQFMKALFSALEQGKLGIFESPTGTGKSLSLICGALTWFLESEKEKKRKLEELVANKDEKAEDDDDDWFAAAAVKQRYNQKRLEAKQELEKIKAKEEKLERLKSKRKLLNKNDVDKNKDEFDELFKEMKWIQKAVNREVVQGSGDEDILVEEYFSDEEEEKDFNAEEEEDGSRKIFFCSRTHSQLTQFVQEVKKSPFSEDVSLVSLASRSNMCVNPNVNSLPSQAAINERCLELGKSKSKPTLVDDDSRPAKKAKTGKSCGCPFNKQANIQVLRDQAVLAIHDIEELVTQGKKLTGCPYYAARSAVPLCQLVVLPYNTLLHAGTRKAVGLNVKNSVVIIDEAHNLLDTITNIHNCSITGAQLTAAHSQLSQYREKYKARLKAKNILYIKQLLFILASFIKVLGGTPGQDPNQPTKVTQDKTELLNVMEFLSVTETYNLNLFRLIKYCNVSQICHKLHGFVEKYQPPQVLTPQDTNASSGVQAFLKSINKDTKKADKNDKKAAEDVKSDDGSKKSEGGGSTTSPLLRLVELLSTLASCRGDSRVVVRSSKNMAEGSIRFLLLDPASQFAQIVREAHSVIVAGGTMKPMEEFRDQLFISAGADLSRVMNFSCDHVVPGHHLMPLVVSKGPTGALLDFSYNHRSQNSTLDELGRVLANVATIIPSGVVVFFPSYAYEELVYNHLDKTGVIARIVNKKKVFREPRKSGSLDKVLADYSSAIRLTPGGGAMLFAVVGGKMSEGINFSDDLGRCVVMVGLPYPNKTSPELLEKMAYLNKTVSPVSGRTAGDLHYQNLCMKAVNQSVGRAIRHKGDYAAILLLDHRFGRENILQDLPSWISKHVRLQDKFGPCIPLLRGFFKEKNA